MTEPVSNQARCAYAPCSEPLPASRRARAFCSRRCKESARKARRGATARMLRTCEWCEQPLLRERASTGRRRIYHHGCAWAARQQQSAAWDLEHERRGIGLDLRAGIVTGHVTDAMSGAYIRALRADPCAYCGGPAGHIDHIVPRAVTGQRVGNWKADRENLTATCRRCNVEKQTAPLLHSLVGFAIRRVIEPLGVEMSAWTGATYWLRPSRAQ